MADLSTTFAGITSPNPFWLASAPPTDKAVNVNRAFEAGWGGVVWKRVNKANQSEKQQNINIQKHKNTMKTKRNKEPGQ